MESTIWTIKLVMLLGLGVGVFAVFGAVLFAGLIDIVVAQLGRRATKIRTGDLPQPVIVRRAS